MAITPAAASASAQRYASPTGSGMACSAAVPCAIDQAVAGASSGDDVTVEPGDYALTATLSDTTQVTIHGVAGQPRPRLLFSGAGQFGVRLSEGSTLRYVEIDQSAQNVALFTDPATIDEVIARGTSDANITANIQKSTMRDSLVVASGANAKAIVTDTNGATNTSEYRNVTAVATGAGGIGIEARADSAAGVATMTLVNVIAVGGPGGSALQANTDSSGAHATIDASNSNYTTPSLIGTNAAITSGGGNQGNPPVFVDPAAGDYREAAGSPTINAGINDPLNGPFDLDGKARAIGATDIGAGEFFGSPTATTGSASAISTHAATLSGTVNANSVSASYKFEYGPTTSYGSVTTSSDAGSGGSPITAAAGLAGLSPATTYHYRLTAISAAGVGTGSDRTFTTLPAPPPPTASPPPPTASPPTRTVSGFAGVTLASTKVTFLNRYIRMTLRCPVRAAGHCSGHVAITVRRRHLTVALGGASFRIAAGKQLVLKARISSAGRKLLASVPSTGGRVTIAAHDATAATKSTMRRVTIRHVTPKR